MNEERIDEMNLQTVILALQAREFIPGLLGSVNLVTPVLNEQGAKRRCEIRMVDARPKVGPRAPFS